MTTTTTTTTITLPTKEMSDLLLYVVRSYLETNEENLEPGELEDITSLLKTLEPQVTTN